MGNNFRKNELISQLIKLAKQLIAGGIPINRQTVFFKQLIHVGVRSGRNTYKDKDNYYYQWDSLHGEWQTFNKNGNHIGVVDQNGELIKQAKNLVKLTYKVV